MTKKIAIIAEHHNGKVRPVTYELFTFAKKIQEQIQHQESSECEISFLLIGEDAEKPAQSISRNTGCNTFSVHVPGLVQYNGSVFIKAGSHFFNKKKFDYICAPHSTSGMDYAPALSVVLNGSCITGVEDVTWEDHNLFFVRSMFGQKISAVWTPNVLPLVMTLVPGSFQGCSPGQRLDHTLEKKSEGRVENLSYACNEENMVYIDTKPSNAMGSALGKADVIVSGGRGIQEEENYKHIEMLADLFSRSATGASRPVCDYGWVKYSKQVGITGTSVSPKLYIACGISGAGQHVEAMRDAGFIVAVNTDAHAPIFRIADVCIVADLIDFIPLFVEKFRSKKDVA